MAKAETTTPAKPGPVGVDRFDHDGRSVIVLVPYNTKDERFCTHAIQDLNSPSKPAITNRLELTSLPLDAIVYSAHPRRVRKQNAKGKFRVVQELFLSKPIDVAADCSKTNKKGTYGAMDPDRVAQQLTAGCCKDRDNRFDTRLFRAQLQGMRILPGKEQGNTRYSYDEAVIILTDL